MPSLLANVVANERTVAWWGFQHDRWLWRRSQSLFIVGIAVSSAAPGGLSRLALETPRSLSESITYHIKSHEGVELDEAMEVAKDDGHREEDDIAGVSAEKPNKLHNLCKGKHEDELGPEGVLPILQLPFACCPPTRSQ